jgi:exoribonuclease-2
MRFLSEIEAVALGKSVKSRICSDLGITEKPEAAHAFLLEIGRWDETVNPHPIRAGCPLSAPQLVLGPEFEAQERVDLEGIESWAVDNAWSTDPDDAVGWDGSSVWIHIADPASAIEPGSPVDREALERGTTLYLPERISPMLPDEALDRFGLGLSETSPALSIRVEPADDGSPRTVEIMPSRVRVRRSSYAEADRAIAEGKAPALTALAALAAKRRSRRLANGAVEIDIPEVRVRVEGEGILRSISIERIEHDASSDLVREMMLLAGEAAARWAFERGLPFPYYGQEAPSEAGQTAQGEGLSAQFARRRLMRAGIWGPNPGAHRGLGLSFYAQVTSPLRRYQDLLAHMQIRACLAGRRVMDEDEISRRCALAQASSALTRQAERSSILHWTLAYLVRSPGWTGEAVIVGPGSGAGGKLFPVYLPDLGLESRIRLRTSRNCDDRIAVRLVGVDLAALEAFFEEAAPQ